MFKLHPVEFLFVILFYKFPRPKNIVFSLCFTASPPPPFFLKTIPSLFHFVGVTLGVSIRVRSEQLIRFPFSLKRQWALISRFTDLRFLKFFFYCNNVSCSLIELYGYKYHISEQIKLKF